MTHQRPDDKTIAAQLRYPHGTLGLRVAEKMNETNLFLTYLAYDLMELQPDDKVLEIGFGNGKFLPVLCKRVQGTVHGIDQSEDMVMRCSQLNEELITYGRLDVRRATLNALPYADKSFDKIVSINTLYFWDFPEEELREVRRVLKPGGRLFLGLRTKTALKAKPQFKYGFTLYEAADVERLLRSMGFEEIGHVHRMEPEGAFDMLVVFGTAY